MAAPEPLPAPYQKRDHRSVSATALSERCARPAPSAAPGRGSSNPHEPPKAPTWAQLSVNLLGKTDVRFHFRKFPQVWQRCWPDLCPGQTPQKAVRKVTIESLFYRFFQFHGMLSAERNAHLYLPWGPTPRDKLSVILILDSFISLLFSRYNDEKWNKLKI